MKSVNRYINDSPRCTYFTIGAVRSNGLSLRDGVGLVAADPRGDAHDADVLWWAA